jgi:hypothetical protein
MSATTTTTASRGQTDGPLTDAQLQAYQRDGFLLVEHLFSPQEMQKWKDRVVQLLNDSTYKGKSGVQVWFHDQLPPDLLGLMTDDRVVQILRQIIGENVEFLSVKTAFKSASTRFATPWHKDRFYWFGAEKISVWLALDDATVENGCLKLIPGTHKQEFQRRDVKDDQSFERRILDTDVAGLPVVTVPVQRGGALFFSDATVHGSHPNEQGVDRWSFISTYRDASVPDDAEVWKSALLLSGTSVNKHAQVRSA